MRFPGILAFLAAAALEAAALSVLVDRPPPNIVGLFGSGLGLGALGIHALASALFALGGVRLSQRENETGSAAGMFAFLLAFATCLPVIGIAGGIILVVLLNLPVHTDPFAEDFATGNPLLDRASNRGIPDVPEADPVPVTVTLRQLDREHIPRLILGLKHFLPAHGARALLRHFQRDASSQVQFYAQSALGDETGLLEDHLAILALRTETHPQDNSPRSSIAEILLHFASLPGTVATDRESQARQALEHLRSLPETPAVLLTLARAHVLLGQTDAAREALGKSASLGAPPHLVEELRREILFLDGDWPALADDSARPLPPSHRAAMKFWQPTTA
jgi:hypothetical protein